MREQNEKHRHYDSYIPVTADPLFPGIATHINAVEGGQLVSTTALSDTGDIAYLNTANTWTTGLQNFSAATLRIPVSTTPSVTVDGDIAFDDVVTNFSGGLIKFFGNTFNLLAMDSFGLQAIPVT